LPGGQSSPAEALILNTTRTQDAQTNQVRQEREANGRVAKTTFCIVDAQSVKTTDMARQSGYDAGKNVRGIKRHIAVDSEGLPHAIDVTTADINDRNGALLMFVLHQETLADVNKVLVDGAYTGERFEQLVWEILGANTNSL
jgi:hypothetical protein